MFFDLVFLYDEKSILNIWNDRKMQNCDALLMSYSKIKLVANWQSYDQNRGGMWKTAHD